MLSGDPRLHCSPRGYRVLGIQDQVFPVWRISIALLENSGPMPQPQPATENLRELLSWMDNIAAQLEKTRDTAERLVLLKEFRLLLGLADVVAAREFPTENR
jgi:hypothetical protein